MSDFPHKISVRDTGHNDDLGGLGQRIYTTAGQGYPKQVYVRSDIWSDLVAENNNLRAENEALKSLLREVAPDGIARVNSDLDKRIRDALLSEGKM